MQILDKLNGECLVRMPLTELNVIKIGLELVLIRCDKFGDWKSTRDVASDMLDVLDKI